MNVAGGKPRRGDKRITIGAGDPAREGGIRVWVDYDDVNAAHARYIARLIVDALAAAPAFEGGCSDEDEEDR